MDMYWYFSGSGIASVWEVLRTLATSPGRNDVTRERHKRAWGKGEGQDMWKVLEGRQASFASNYVA